MSDNGYSIIDLSSSGIDEAVSGQSSPFVLLRQAGGERASSSAAIAAAGAGAGPDSGSSSPGVQRGPPHTGRPDSQTQEGEDVARASSCSDSAARRADKILESEAPSPGGAAEAQAAADPLLADLERYDLSGLGFAGGEEGEDDDGGEEGGAMVGLLAGLDDDTLSGIPPALLQRLQQLEEERDELAGRLLESDAELSSLRANYQQLSQTHASNQTWLNQLMTQQMENLERRQRRQRALAAAAAARAVAAVAGAGSGTGAVGGAQPQVVSITPMSGLLDSTVLETGDFDFTGEVDSVLLDQEDLAAVAATAAAAGVAGAAGGGAAGASGVAGSLGASPLKAPPSAKKLAASALGPAAATPGGGGGAGAAAPVDVMALAAEQPRGPAAAAVAAAAASPPGKSKARETPKSPTEPAAKPRPAAVAEESPVAATQVADEQKQAKGSKQKEDDRKPEKAPAGSAAAQSANAEVKPLVVETEAAASQQAATVDTNADKTAAEKVEAASKRVSREAASTAEPARSEPTEEAEPAAKVAADEKSVQASSSGDAGSAKGVDPAHTEVAKARASSAAPVAAAAVPAKSKANETSAAAATAPRAAAKAPAPKAAAGGGGSFTLVLALLVVVALAAGSAYVFLGGGLSPVLGPPAAPAAVKPDSAGVAVDTAARAAVADDAAAPGLRDAGLEPVEPPPSLPPPPPEATSEAVDDAASTPSTPGSSDAPDTIVGEPAFDETGTADSGSNVADAAPGAPGRLEDEHVGFMDVYDDEYEDPGDDEDGAAAAAAAAAALDAGDNVRFATLVSAAAAYTPEQFWCADAASCDSDVAGGAGGAPALAPPSPHWELLRAGLAEAAGEPGAAMVHRQPSCESLRALATALSATDAELASAGKQPAAAPACTAAGSGAGECRLPPSKTAGTPYPVDARAEVVKLGMGELEKRWRQLQRTLERLAGEGDAKDGAASAQPPAEPAVQAVAAWALGHLLPVVAPMVRSVVDDDELPESLKRAHKAAADVARVCSEKGPQLSTAALGRLEAQLNDVTNIALVHVDGGGAAAVEARLVEAARCLAWIAPRAEAEACRLRCSPRGRLVGALGGLDIPRALLDGALKLGRSVLDEREGVWRHEQPPGEDATAQDVEAWLRSTQHLAEWVEAALTAEEGGNGVGDGAAGSGSGGEWQPLLSAIGGALRKGAAGGGAAVSGAVAEAAEAGDWRRLRLELAAEMEAAQRLPGYVVEVAAEAARRAFAELEGHPDCGACETAGEDGEVTGAEEAGVPGPACRAGLRSLGVEVRAVQATAGGGGGHGTAAAGQGLSAAVRRIRADVLDLRGACAVVRARCMVAAEGVLEFRKAGLE